VASDLFGTRAYVPGVRVPEGYTADRFRIYLLEDDALTASDTASLPLDALVLAEQPLLDLSDITFVHPTRVESESIPRRGTPPRG
jgi:hypothetical protein